MSKPFEHRFEKFKEVEERGCLRCNNYKGYGAYKIKDLPEGKVLWGTRVLCTQSECKPSLKPIPCNYCYATPTVFTDLEKALEKVEDQELKSRLKELQMCPDCYENWMEECLCLLCAFDYPNSKIPGKKGEYCFCKGCEWDDECPDRRKAFPDCVEMREIDKERVKEITELI